MSPPPVSAMPRLTKYYQVAAELFGIKALPEPGVCIVQGCDRLRSNKGDRYCFTHSQRIAAHLNPVAHQYHRLKNAAKRRKIPFLLTKEEWRGFCEATGYMKNRNVPRAEMPSVDRREDDGPYALWNIRVLTVAENAAGGRAAAMKKKTRTIKGRQVSMAEYRAPKSSDPLDDL